MGEMVEFASNGGTARATSPRRTTWAPVIVIQEWWGLVPHIKDVADRFAADGFVALAPICTAAWPRPRPDEAGKLMMALNIEQAAKDLSGAVAKVQEVSDASEVGVTGFCMGGGLALALARRPTL